MRDSFVGDDLPPRTTLTKYQEKHNLVLICNGIDKEIRRIGISQVGRYEFTRRNY